jgi:hypothetical protein
LQYRGEGGLKALPKTIPAQLHGNAHGIDLKKRTQQDGNHYFIQVQLNQTYQFHLLKSNYAQQFKTIEEME